MWSVSPETVILKDMRGKSNYSNFGDMLNF